MRKTSTGTAVVGVMAIVGRGLGPAVGLAPTETRVIVKPLSEVIRPETFPVTVPEVAVELKRLSFELLQPVSRTATSPDRTKGRARAASAAAGPFVRC